MARTFLTIFEFQNNLFANFQHKTLSINIVEFHLGLDSVKVKMISHFCLFCIFYCDFLPFGNNHDHWLSDILSIATVESTITGNNIAHEQPVLGGVVAYPHDRPEYFIPLFFDIALFDSLMRFLIIRYPLNRLLAFRFSSCMKHVGFGEAVIDDLVLYLL